MNQGELVITTINQLRNWLLNTANRYRDNATQEAHSYKTKRDKSNCLAKITGFNDALDLLDVGINALERSNNGNTSVGLKKINETLPPNASVYAVLSTQKYHFIIDSIDSQDGDANHLLPESSLGYTNPTDALLALTTFIIEEQNQEFIKDKNHE